MLRADKVVLVTFCALIALPGLANGQAPGEIGGVVRDQAGHVNQLAQVRAIGREVAAAPDTLHVVVDSTGRYRIRIRWPGHWRVEPRHIGYARAEPAWVEVGVGECVEMDLLLAPALPPLREMRSNP
jgi:hypothetical protein